MVRMTLHSSVLSWAGFSASSPITCLFVAQPCITLVAQTLKHLPIMLETRVRSLGQEDLLEKETAAHSSTLAWEAPWTDEPGGLQSTGLQ